MSKHIIYQIFTRLFGNKNDDCILNGNRVQNGSGKFSDISVKALDEIKKLGVTHIWYTGVIEHATVDGHPDNNIKGHNSAVVKGMAGSPYAICDYFDVNPGLADNVPDRLKEFKELISRTHEIGMKVIIDFVPNHLARNYYSDIKTGNEFQFGGNDDNTKSFDINNNFYYIPGKKLVLPEELSQDEEYNELPAKASGNNQFSEYVSVYDWYETVKLNYGIDNEKDMRVFNPIPDTWKKMLNVLLYWSEMGIDGFRCDMAELSIVWFHKEFNFSVLEIAYE